MEGDAMLVKEEDLTDGRGRDKGGAGCLSE